MIRRLFGLALLGLLLQPIPAVSESAVEIREFASEELRERYQALSNELRCPKCSNQSLYESDAQIAADLRRELHRLLHEGWEDAEILNYMTERYGDFIRYRPRFYSATLLLWLLPLCMVVGGAVAIVLWRRHALAAPLRAAAPADNPQSRRSLLRMRWLVAAVLFGSLGLYVPAALHSWRDWNLGQVFHENGPLRSTDMARVEALYRSAPDNELYALTLGRAYLRSGRYADAEKVFARSSSLVADSTRLQNLAQLAGLLKRRSAQERDANISDVLAPPPSAGQQAR